MKAAFLIRCSTKKQDYIRQINDLTRLCKQLGYETSEDLIFGEHITGKDDATVRYRESISKLMEAANENKFDVVLVTEVSRMSRDPMSGRLFVRELINMSKPVYFRDIDTWSINPQTGKRDPNAEQVIGAGFDAAWKYLRSMKTQIASGRRVQLANNQITVGKPYFGYKRYSGKDRELKNTLVVDEEVSMIVPDIYNEYLKEGATLKSTALAITAKYGERLNRKFSIGNIEHILLYKPYATGVIPYTLTDPDTEEVDKYEISIPTLIPMEVWEAATKKRTTNRVAQNPYPKQTTYVLSKLLKCPHCGYTMTPRRKGNEPKDIANKGRYRYINGKLALSWHCMSGVNNATACTNRTSINNQKIEPIIWELVKMELIGYANMDKEDKVAKLNQLKEQEANHEADILNFENHKKSLDGIVDRAYNAYINAPANLPTAAVERLQNDYYKALAKAEADKANDDSNIERLKREIEILKFKIEFYSTSYEPDELIAKAEGDDMEKRKLVTQLISVIYPYKITTYKSPSTNRILKNGVTLLEVHTISGVFYVFFDANQSGKVRNAYYLSADITYSGSAFASDYIRGLGKELFYIKSPNQYFTEDNPRCTDNDAVVGVNDFVEIAKANNCVISYDYK